MRSVDSEVSQYADGPPKLLGEPNFMLDLRATWLLWFGICEASVSILAAVFFACVTACVMKQSEPGT